MKRFLCVLLPLILLPCVGGYKIATAQATTNTPTFAWVPLRDQNYSSTREITRLEVLTDGTLWAFAGGSALRLQNGAWKRFDAAPSEVATRQPTSVKWRGQTVKASFDGLSIGDGNAIRHIAMPPSSGTHISALLPRGNMLWAALFGDGIWSWNGISWSHPELHLPPQAREITALAESSNAETVWIGTRRQGVWQLSKGQWHQHLEPDEPFAHNIQSLCSFRGALWASTLEDGLVVCDANGWQHIGKSKSTLSSNAPRQMAVFAGKLYVRHSNEIVDQFDGTTWKRNVFPLLPRKQIISLAADDKCLYLGQWGGWSEWDGKTFSHHLRLPNLQIVPLQHICPDGPNLWLGTENRGLFCWKRDTQKLEHFDESDGLPDHWITAINRTGSTVFAGTFGSGLACYTNGSKAWQIPPELKGIGITSIVSGEAGQTWIATRYGLFQRSVQGEVQACDANLSTNQREIQTLLWTPNGLWLGTRNGLIFRTRATLNGNIP